MDVDRRRLCLAVRAGTDACDELHRPAELVPDEGSVLGPCCVQTCTSGPACQVFQLPNPSAGSRTAYVCTGGMWVVQYKIRYEPRLFIKHLDAAVVLDQYSNFPAHGSQIEAN